MLNNPNIEQRRIKGWLNLYEGHTSIDLYPNKDCADEMASIDRIACIYVDVPHGEGL